MDKKQKTGSSFKFFKQTSFWHGNSLDNIVSKNAQTQVFKALPVKI